MTFTPHAAATSWANLIPASPSPTTDQTAALQAALTAHQAQGWGVVDLQGCRVRVDGGLTVNPLFTSIRNGILDFGHMTSGTALLVSTDATTNDFYGGLQHSLRDVEMIGATAVDGLSFNSTKTDNILDAAWNVDGLSVHGFNRNIVLANHTYCTYFRAIRTFQGVTSNIATVAGSVDSGERIHFEDCVSFNGNVGLDNSGGFELSYSGSIDYNTGPQIKSAGDIEFFGHVEFTPSSSFAPFQLNDGDLIFSDMSTLLFNGYNGSTYVAPYAFATNYSHQYITLPNIPGHNYGVGGTSGLISGPGIIQQRTTRTVTAVT